MTEEILLLTDVYKLMNPVPYVIATMEKKVEKSVVSEKQSVVDENKSKTEEQTKNTSSKENENMYVLSIIITIIAGVYVLYKLKKVR